MRAWRACLLGFVFAWSGAVGVVACGAGSEPGPGIDASTDRASRPDVFKPDHHVRDRSAPPDVTADSSDAGLTGHCSPVNGPACDIVLQNCPTMQECVIVSDPSAESGLGISTQCMAEPASEHLPAGTFCCPESTNQCLPGMTCLGQPCMGDAGSKGGGGRCSPACCPSDGGVNTANCGMSPEGYVGICNLDITGGNMTKSDPNGTLYNACLYEKSCVVFGTPCPHGYECLVVDKSGTSKCSEIYEPDGSLVGFPAGTPCTFVNQCATGMTCVPFKSGPICSYYCSTGTGTPPFDAGALDGMPGSGGCPKGEAGAWSCIPDPNLPNWLGVCAPP